jgi:hypothetical protein
MYFRKPIALKTKNILTQDSDSGKWHKWQVAVAVSCSLSRFQKHISHDRPAINKESPCSVFGVYVYMDEPSSPAWR